MRMLFAHPMQVADATFAMEGAINAAVEKWYTSAGWQGNKVGPRPRTARPPPPANVVLGTLLATLHEVRALQVAWCGGGLLASRPFVNMKGPTRVDSLLQPIGA